MRINRGRSRAAVVLSALGLAAAALTGCVRPSSSGEFITPGGPATAVAPGTSSPGPADKGTTFTLSAVGDVIMAAAPGHIPPNGGAGFFDPVEDALHADLQMANLEEELTDVAASPKCSAQSLGRTCFAWRAPASFAKVLQDAGFDLVNIANNHTMDFGQAGKEETESVLTAAGIAYTGPPGVIRLVTVKGVRVAVLGFAPYAWANDLRNIGAAQELVRQAKRQADVVIVQAHMGAEGAAYQHVRPGTEVFLGENRGDTIAFSHAVVDAGADLVIGHSPHVLRAMEIYKGHLIAYSLGNFAGYHALSTGYPMNVSMVLHATLRQDGTLVSAAIVPASMYAPGVPKLDPAGRAIPLVRSLTEADFPDTGAQIADDGTITPPRS
ncbi:MAG TPA: CapA family protein [Micromonosporaceae bacterium]|nr:CapA family protein [Micromonosporaceae bacterium]